MTATARLRSPPIAARRTDRLAMPAWLELMLLGAAGAAASIALTGFEFGIVNNLFHLPIVDGLLDEPQYAADPFFQSLRHFSSGLWMVLAGAGRYIPAYWLFLSLDLLSRLLCFVALLLCASLVGVRSRSERVVFVVLCCFSSLLHGYAYPGNGGLFINYFSHSEVANATILLSFYCAVSGRWTWAVALDGGTFFLNGFMAIWAAAPMAAIAALALWRGETAARHLVRQVAAGAAIAACVAAPAVWNILSNAGLHARLPIDDRVFLQQYYPDHVLISAASPRHLAALVVVVVYGLSCAWALPGRAAAFAAALLGAAALFVAGAALPYVTGAPLLLDLHLLRSSAMIHLLAAMVGTALAARCLCSADQTRSRVFGPLLALAAATWRTVLPVGIVAAGVLEVACRRGWSLPERPVWAWVRVDLFVAALLIGLVWPRLALQDAATNRHIRAATADWAALGAWARASTPIDAVFLVPTRPMPRATAPTATPDPAENDEAFEALSHRRIWVDFRRGAAVLWSPGYYRIWWPRVQAVMALRTLPERIDYARRQGVPYVIDPCPAAPGSALPRAVFQVRDLCVFQALAGE